MKFLPNISTHNKIVGASALALLTGVFIYMYKQFKLLYNAVYTVAGAVVHNISATDINFTLLLKIDNKGDLNVDISSQNYDVYFNDSKVAHIEYPTKEQVASCNKLSGKDKKSCLAKYNTHIASNSSSTIPLYIQFDPRDLLKNYNNIAALIADKSKIGIKIKGAFTFTAGPITMKNFPFEETLTLNDLTKPKT